MLILEKTPPFTSFFYIYCSIEKYECGHSPIQFYGKSGVLQLKIRWDIELDSRLFRTYRQRIRIFERGSAVRGYCSVGKETAKLNVLLKQVYCVVCLLNDLVWVVGLSLDKEAKLLCWLKIIAQFCDTYSCKAICHFDCRFIQKTLKLFRYNKRQSGCSMRRSDRFCYRCERPLNGPVGIGALFGTINAQR